ncbi:MULTISPECIES: tetratricopeptide repeat protein [Massilia]|uniref:Tetratricopeptide repeat protein n=1 Tax=Massilia haematophila TaxID=457923 RepID=A0ABV7PHT7_9BURK|nr:tetratricopeptide repeat protein [Massilia sp.]
MQPVAVEPEIHTMTRDDALRLAGEAERVLAAGRLADAGAAYIRIVTAFPDDARAWFRLGTIYLRTGQYGAAQMACERALRLEPGMAKAQANLALAHLRQFRAAAERAAASAEVPEDNRKALAVLMRDVDRAVGPPVVAYGVAQAGVAQ